MGALRDMNRKANLMRKIIDFEMKRIEKLDFLKVSSMPNYSDRKRGPFLIAYWHERCGDSTARLIVQVYLYRCFGIGDVCVGGMQFTSDGKRLLTMKEMTAYY